MKTRIYPLVLGMAFATGAAVLLGGCNRQEPVPPGASAPPKTSVGTQIDDTVVTTKVKSALLQNPEVKGLEIKVETRKGTVQLSGFVDTQAQADSAVTIARGVEGVSGVENGMTVKDVNVTVGNKVDDGIVIAKVKSALVSDANVKGFDIAVAAKQGEVQLSGFVDNQAQIDRAMELARGVEGVKGVDNKMSIKK